jgi:hypothetical protein
MVFWTDDNTRDSPTTYDMDGEGTPLRPGDNVVLQEHHLYCEGFDVVRVEDYQIILTPEMNYDILLSFVVDEGLNCGANWKFEAAGPPPSCRENFTKSNLYKILKESGINIGPIDISSISVSIIRGAGVEFEDTNHNVRLNDRDVFQLMEGSGTDPPNDFEIDGIFTRSWINANRSLFASVSLKGMSGGVTAWTDANTAASPVICDNMDGSGTDLASGDTVNFATKTLTMNNISTGCGNVSCPNFIAYTTLTMDNGTTFTTTSSCLLSGVGKLTLNNTTASFTGIGTAEGDSLEMKTGGTLLGSTGSVTIGCMYIENGNYTATTGTTTFNNINAATTTFAVGSSGVFNNNGGTMSFVNNGDGGNRDYYGFNPVTFNNLIVNLTGAGTNSFLPQTNCNAGYSVGGNLTITNGNLYMNNTFSMNLTVTGTTSVTNGILGLSANFTKTLQLNGNTTIESGGTIGGNYAGLTLDLNGELQTSAGTLSLGGTANNYSPATWRTPTTLTHNNRTFTFDRAGTTTFGNDSTQFYAVTITSTVLDTGGYAFTCSNALTFAITLYLNTSTVIIGGNITNTGGMTGDAGGATAYNLTTNGTYVATSGGTVCPTASGSWNMNGSQFAVRDVTFTHSSGLITFGYAGTTTLGSDCTGLYKITVSNGTTLDCTASNYKITAASDVIVTGALNGRASNPLTFGSLVISPSTGSFTAGSNVKITSRNSSNVAWSNGNTFTAGAGSDIDFQGQVTSGTYDILGDNTWAYLDLSLTAAATYRFEAGKTQTITVQIAFSGSAGNLIILNSTTGAAAWILTIQAGKIQSFSYLSIRYSDATPGDDATATKSVNNGNNSGWIFTGQPTDSYWVGGAGSWSDAATHWASSTGGAANAANIPSAGTNIHVDDSSDSGGAFAITLDMNTPSDGLGTVDINCHQTATIAVVTYTFRYTGVFTQTNGAVTITTGTITADGTTTITGGTFGSNTAYVLDMNANLLTSTGTLLCPNATGTFTYSGATWKEPSTFTTNSGKVTFDLGGTTTLGNTSTGFNDVTVSDGATLASSTYNITVGGNLIVGGGASGVLTTSTGTKTITGTTTINSGATLGTATTTYTLDMNGNLLTSAGTLIAPQAAGTFTYSGATWLSPTVFTHSSGTVTFDLAGTTTLGNASTAFNAITINNGATLNTSAASSYALTTVGNTTVTGTLVCNNSDITIDNAGTTYYLTVGGIFTGGTGTHIIGSMYQSGASNNITLSSGTTTFNGICSIGGYGATWLCDTGSTFAHGSGTLVFSYAGTQLMWRTDNVATTFNNLTVSTTTFGFYSGKGFNITVAGNLNQTTGSWSMAPGSVGKTLTVTGTSTIGGTITSAMSSGATTFTFNNTITITGTLGNVGGYAYAIDMNANLLASSGTLIAGNNTFTYSGATWLTPTTFTAGTYTVTFDLAGTTSLGNASTQFNAITIGASTTLSCSGTNYALTAAGDVIATGTLNGTGAAVSLKDLTISTTTGVYTATTATTTITGKNASSDAWVNNHTFTCGTGKVDFTGTGASYHIHGSNTWYDLEISLGTASTYLFGDDPNTQTISNSTKLTGAAGQLLTLNSVSGADHWLYTIQAGKTQTHDYLDVNWSDASGGDEATQTNSTETGDNNVNWAFGPTTVTWAAAGNDNWSTNAAWSGAAKPAATDIVVFDATSVKNCIVDEATASLATFTLTTGYTGTLTINYKINVAGDVTVDFGGSGTYAGAEGFNITDTSVFSTDQTNLGLLTVNASGKTVTLGAALAATTVVITAGTLNTSAASSFGLTTTAGCTVVGTLTCNASTVSCTGKGATGGMSLRVEAGGTFTGGSGAHTFGSMDLRGTVTLTSGNTTINNIGWAAAGILWFASTFDDGNGTVIFTYAGAQNLIDIENVTRTLYNVQVNNASCALSYYTGYSFPLTVANNLTITAGSFTTWDGTTSANLTVTGTSSITGTLTPGATSTCTFNGAVTVNSGGVLGGNTAWTCDINTPAVLTISAGGTFNAPTGATFTFYRISMTGAGTFNDDGGTANCDAAEGGLVDATTLTFTNLTFSGAGSRYAYMTAITVKGTLTTTTCTVYTTYARDSAITMGTVSASGAIVNNGGFAALGNNTATIQAASATYPVTITGTDFNWDDVAGAVWNLKWLDYQIDAVTGGGGCTVNWTGNMKTKSWTTTVGDTLVVTDGITITGVSVAATKYVNAGTWTWGTFTISLVDIQFDVTTPGTGKTITVAGNIGIDAVTVAATDTLTCTVAGTTITGSASKIIHVYGAIQFNGTVGSPIIFQTYNQFNFAATPTLNLQYVTLNCGGTWPITFGDAAQITAITITNFDNVTSNGVSGPGIFVINSTVTITATNCTFAMTGSTSAWYQSTIALNTGQKLQLSGCTFTTVGMQATSGWLVSVDGSGNYTHYGILASSETPSSGYRGSQCTGTFLNKNADAYSTSFNSSYTLGAAMTGLTGLTINASTTFDTSSSGNYALTVTGGQTYCNGGSATLNANNSTLNLGTALTTNYALRVSGVFNGGTGTHNVGSIIHDSGGSIVATSGTMYLTSPNPSAYLMSIGTGGFTHSNGTVEVTQTSDPNSAINLNANFSFYNFIINQASTITSLDAPTSTRTLTIANNLTITIGTLDTKGGARNVALSITSSSSITGTLTPNSSTCTFGGAVTINNGGTLGGNTDWTCDMNATTVNTFSTGSTFNAPTAAGSWTLSGLFNGGIDWGTVTFNNDGGTLTVDGLAWAVKSGTGITFNNVTLSSVGGLLLNSSTTATVTGILNYTAAGYILTSGGAAGSATLTMGTTGAAGSITTSAAMNPSGVAGETINIQAASASYLCTCTGTDWDWDNVFSTINLKWLDYQINATTGGGRCAIVFTNNMTIDSWTTSTLDNLTISTGAILTASGDIVTSGMMTGNASTINIKSMTISASGTYNATSGTTTITGEDASNYAWNNLGGGFNNVNGKVDFQGQATPYIITGNNTWYDLEISVSVACAYYFESGKTQTIAHSVVLSGASGALLTLDATGITDWKYTIQAGASQTHSYLNVNHSDASLGETALATDGTSVDGGTNTNWLFGGPSGAGEQILIAPTVNNPNLYPPVGGVF